MALSLLFTPSLATLLQFCILQFSAICPVCPMARRTVPVAVVENPLERKIEKRQRGLEKAFASDEFVALVKAGVVPPQGPDPTDLTLSKRAWESALAGWRWDIRFLALGLRPS